MIRTDPATVARVMHLTVSTDRKCRAVWEVVTQSALNQAALEAGVTLRKQDEANRWYFRPWQDFSAEELRRIGEGAAELIKRVPSLEYEAIATLKQYQR